MIKHNAETQVGEARQGSVRDAIFFSNAVASPSSSVAEPTRMDETTVVESTRKRTRAIFGEDYAVGPLDFDDTISHRAKIASKILNEYNNVKELPFFLAERQGQKKQKPRSTIQQAEPGIQTKLIEDVQRTASSNEPSNALTVRVPTTRPGGVSGSTSESQGPSSSLTVRREHYQPVKPQWHAPWKLRTVIRYFAPPLRSVLMCIVVI